MLKLSYHQHRSIFKEPGGTSRGVLHSKDSWIVSIWDDQNPEVCGLGEVSIIPGLSIDEAENIPKVLDRLALRIDQADVLDQLEWYPAVKFGVESALLDFEQGGKQVLFPSPFTKGLKPIPINGLIWMGSFEEMKFRIEEKLNSGFDCIKVKIGAIDFLKELDLIKMIRERFDKSTVEIRLDANGAFSASSALDKLKALAPFDIHSVEQPIKPNQWSDMAKICEESPIPIALDEELIGINHRRERIMMLDEIKPQFLVLKPSLLGGFESCDEWIELAQKHGIDWWVTSALETNIGLNAIAQWIAIKDNKLPQGLGTGQLFSNNFLSNLSIRNGKLWYEPSLDQ